MKKSKATLSIIIILTIVIISVNQKVPSHAATLRYFDNVESSEFPERLKNNLSNQPWEDGFIDITREPYNAKGDGITDDTQAIQDAIDDAYASNLIVYFPQGTYLVSQQLKAYQYYDNWYHSSGWGSQRKFGNLLVGQTDGSSRPVIKLADNSTVSDNILLMFKWYNPLDPSEDGRPKHYLATFRGINIDMGNNPDVSALSMDGAQYCTIQDSDIYGTDYNVGIHKIPGAVGSIINVTVTSGNIGILCDSYAPQPLITSVNLYKQNECGIKITDTRHSTVNLIGFNIVSKDNPDPSYRAVYVEKNPTKDRKKEEANVYLQDGSIEVKGPDGTAIENAVNNKYKNNGQQVILNNVYFKSHIIMNNPLQTIAGDNTKWKRINDYAYSPGVDDKSVYGGYIVIDDDIKGEVNEDIEYYDDITDEVPPDDLVSRHNWPVILPSYDDSNKINIVTDYGATPYDHTDDDSIAIQQAIDDTTNPLHRNYGKSIFIPRGHFHVRNNLLLKKGTTIFGAGKNISVIHVDEEFTISSETYLLDTEIETDADIIMSDFALLKQEASVEKNLTDHKFMGFMRIRGNNTVFRDVQLAMVEQSFDNYYQVPEILFTDNAGGKFYNVAVNTAVKYAEGGNVSGDYRRVLIEDTTNPLTFYQLGVNNAEKSVLLEIDNCENVNIYALKYEEQNRLFKIKDCNDISIIGGYGYYSLVDNHPSIIDIENSSNIYLAAIARLTMTKVGEYQGRDWLINGDTHIPDDHTIVLYECSDSSHVNHPSNLLENGDFESGLTNFSATGNASVELESNNIYEDSYSCKVSNRESEDDSISYDITDILDQNGKGYYTGVAWVRNSTDIESNMKIRFQLTDDNGTHTYQLAEGCGISWQRLNYEIDLTWSGKLKSARMFIINENETENYYVDSVELLQGQHGFDRGTNLLSNGGFEKGSSTWNVTNGSSSLTIVDTSVKEGNHAAHITQRQDVEDGITQDITNIIEQYGKGEYDLNAFVRLGSGIEKDTYVQLKIKDSTGNESTYTKGYPSNEFKWTPMGITAYIDWEDDLDSAEISIVTKESLSDLYIDDIRLVKKGYTDVSPFCGIINGDFETGDLTGWMTVGSPRMNTNTDSGNYCVKLTPKGPQEIYQTFTVTSGKTYEISALIDVVYTRGIMEVLDGNDVIESARSTDRDWTKKTITVQAPADTTELTLRFRTVDGNSIKVDNVTVEEL